MRPAVTIIAALLLLALIGACVCLYTPDKPRTAMEAKYARLPSAFLEVAGIRLHLRDTGPRGAPALVMLHGFGASLHTWDEWADQLSADHRVIRLDLPGFGLTGADPTGEYTDARTIAVLLALLGRSGVQRATLIGNSMGGGSLGGSRPRIPTACRSSCSCRRTASSALESTTAKNRTCR